MNFQIFKFPIHLDSLGLDTILYVYQNPENQGGWLEDSTDKLIFHDFQYYIKSPKAQTLENETKDFLDDLKLPLSIFNTKIEKLFKKYFNSALKEKSSFYDFIKTLDLPFPFGEMNYGYSKDFSMFFFGEKFFKITSDDALFGLTSNERKVSFQLFFADFKNVLNNLNTGIKVQLDLHFDIDNTKLVKKSK